MKTESELKKLAEFREKLASLCHDQWSGWMKYLFSKGQFNKDGTFTIPKWAVERWVMQMGYPYLLLSKEEKESDRKEADKFIALWSAIEQTGER